MDPHGHRANTIIAGVNKAGTSSLFTALSSHPQVAPSSVKETHYFMPARYGRPLAPVEVYERYFTKAGERPVRLEATPSYLYGGTAVVGAIRSVCDAPRIVVCLRDPVERLISFFTYQKTRLRIAQTMSLSEYVDTASGLDDAAFADPDNERWLGLRGGCYAEYLAPWLSSFGPDLRVVFFDDLVARTAVVLIDLAAWLGIDGARYPSLQLPSENRTTGFRHRGLQRVAIACNDRFDRFLRRHHRFEEMVRGAYYRLNARRGSEQVPDTLRQELLERYRGPNARLAEMLGGAGYADLPAWLRDGGASDRVLHDLSPPVPGVDHADRP